MVPILAVEDPDAARLELAATFGFDQISAGRMAYGDQQIAIISKGDNLPGMLPMRLDHVAFSTPDVDILHSRISARGGRLASGFTPNGPKNISEFWANGVRYVFFDGPDGWPFEFCAKIGTIESRGHSHFAIRTPDLDSMESRLVHAGADRVACYELADGANSISVRFLGLSGYTFELFDEGPHIHPDPLRGWIGLIPMAGFDAQTG